jgi:hypothetical protein
MIRLNVHTLLWLGVALALTIGLAAIWWITRTQLVCTDCRSLDDVGEYRLHEHNGTTRAIVPLCVNCAALRRETGGVVLWVPEDHNP